MRLANHDGRAALVLGDEVADVAAVSGGSLGPDLADCYERFDELADLAGTLTSGTGPLDPSLLGCPAQGARQVFAVGLNYAEHAAEASMSVPAVPAVFTKFPACLAGPHDDIVVVGDSVDWEVELVVVVGRLADRVSADEAWSHIAGVTVGQDVSDRTLQFAAGGQFSLGKSRRGYGPMGPWVVSPDELAERDDLALGCAVDGEVVQQARTSQMLHGVGPLLATLSEVLPLWPGDVVFTGTPAGVGFSRTPPRALRPGMVLESWIDGVGALRNRCV